MPKYSYTAKSLEGEEKKGVLETKDIQQLSQILRKKGFNLIKAKSESEKKEPKISFSFRGVGLTEKMFFVRNLQVMIAAGLPLPRALGVLFRQTKNKKFKKVLLHIQEEIIKGKSFSGALSEHPDIFPEIFQNIIMAGEESGTLNKVLQTLSVQMEKEYTLKSKVKGAMIYPAVIVFAMLGIGILMLVTVIPILAQTFEELGIELPVTTKAIIALADFLINKWPLVLAGFFVLVIASSQAIKREKIKKIVDRIILKIPVMSQIVRSTNSACMLRTLGSLISAGISLPKALKITSGVLENIHFKNALIGAVEKVKKGGKLSEALETYEDVYPLIIIQMIAVGEETGETSNILSRLANFFEEEVYDITKNLTSIIEPFLILIIGATIEFFAVSMIQPMYSMLGAIK